MLKKTVFFLTILWIGVIWIHSSMPADISSGESGAVAQWLESIGLVADGEVIEHIIRKIAHFVEFGILGFLVMLNVYINFKPNKEYFLTALLFGILIPLIDETIQLFPQGRNSSVVDVWLDFSGYFTGAVILITVYKKLINHYK